MKIIKKKCLKTTQSKERSTTVIKNWEQEFKKGTRKTIIRENSKVLKEMNTFIT